MFALACLAVIFSFQDSELYIQERFRVEFVLLDVQAYDKKGNLITDLKPSDFEVTENKNKVEVTYFDMLDYRKGATPDVSDVPEEHRAEVIKKTLQQIIIAVDAESLEELDSKKVFDQLEEFVQSLDKDAEYRFNVYSMERGSITKGFVNTPDQALASLVELRERHFAGLERKRGGYSNSDALLLGDSPGASRRGSTSKRGFGGVSMLSDGVKFADLEKAFSDCHIFGNLGQINSCISETLSEFMEEQKFRKERMIGELELLTYSFEKVDGLKTMLFVSPGFPLANMSSAFELAEAYRAGGRDSVFLDAGHNALETDADFRRVLHACIKNRVIFNTFDIFNGGEALKRQVSLGSSAAPTQKVVRAYRNFAFDVSDGLRSLADESGGTYHRTPRLKGAMTDTLEGSRFYYVLGYNSSPSDKPGQFRKIKIKAKRKGVKLKHRKGYFGS